MQRIARITPDRHSPDALPVVALAHNEANILGDFLAHYRSICTPSFLIVDDQSDDGSFEMLAEQPDVTVFRPVAGSTYARDKAQWRSDLLDTFCDGRWCLVPDLDEHFVWAGMPALSLASYIAQLEAEGAQAVATLMVDMYGDMALGDHVHPKGSDMRLRQRFPLFDGPAPFPDGYFMRPISARRRRDYPTPPVAFSGGARNRLFHFNLTRANALQRWLIERYLRPDRAINISGLEEQAQALARLLTRRLMRGALNNTKLGLLRWQSGWRFNGGAHKLDAPVPVSESIAAFLHYPFTRGREGIAYIATRGQHAEGSRFYREILEVGGPLDRSPVFAYTRRFDGVADLAGLVRGLL